MNHFVGAGNDMLDHRNPSAGCTKWGNKTTTAIPERQSPFYTHAYTYKYNPVFKIFYHSALKHLISMFIK